MWMMLVTLDRVELEEIGRAGLAEAIKDLLIEGGWAVSYTHLTLPTTSRV